MDQTAQPAQPKGNFTANLIANAGVNRYNKRLPDVRGRISAPDAPDRMHDLALYSFEYTDKETGEVMIGFNGSVNSINRADSAMDQLRAHTGRKNDTLTLTVNNISLENGKITVFQSKHKDGEVAANGNRKSEFYGYWNNNGKLVQIGVWTHKNKETGIGFLGGSTQYPLPGKEQADFGSMSQDEIDSLAASYEQSIDEPSRLNGTDR